ncbi:hypothetical protein [Allomuricauda sp. SCSIO 65647]|uniref:hypothetical protein n=1 Tax=Allomuricauda sp. SCSIO 65647 TaxID=2908843 RepID=UPI001F168907|nr:hypothetical protein [Muricauda sp. SCSIO 65647]UJH66551.1 hypothetical protein L0P89_11330 [Muricauda sp. SCSIO 65647]
MKNKSIINLVLAACFIFLAGSCEDTDKLPVKFDELEVSGLPFIQIISSEGDAAIDLFNPAGSIFSREYQVVSLEDGSDVQRVELYVSFTENTVPAGTPIAPTPEVLYQSFDSGVFDTGGQFPTFSVTYNGQEVLDLLGLTQGDLEGTDAFNFRWSIIADSGTFTDVSANFDNQSADHTITANVVCLLDPALFTGDYTLTTTATGIFGTVLFSQGTVTIESTGSTTRAFTTGIYPDLGDFGTMTFNFELVCDQVLVPGDQATGVGCGASTTLGPPSGGDNGTFDFTDESTFTINVTDDEAGICGGPFTVRMTFTKV